VTVLLGASGAQVPVVPAWAGGSAQRHPEVAHLVVPSTMAAVLAVACLQAALLAVWRLLALVRVDLIFSDRALRWVDAAAAGVGVAVVLLLRVARGLLRAATGYRVEMRPPATPGDHGWAPAPDGR
jgi:hypothetical protein